MRFQRWYSFLILAVFQNAFAAQKLVNVLHWIIPGNNSTKFDHCIRDVFPKYSANRKQTQFYRTKILRLETYPVFTVETNTDIPRGGGLLIVWVVINWRIFVTFPP